MDAAGVYLAGGTANGLQLALALRFKKVMSESHYAHYYLPGGLVTFLNLELPLSSRKGRHCIHSYCCSRSLLWVCLVATEQEVGARPRTA